MPTIRMPSNLDDYDHLIVEIKQPVSQKDYRELLTRVTLLSAIKDIAVTRQGMRPESLEFFSEGNTTVDGLQVSTYLAEKFTGPNFTPKEWQSRVHIYESCSVEQLQELIREITSTIETLKHTCALQEVNRAYAYLERYYPVPRKRLREGELSGLANPDMTVPVVPPDDNGQCPQGYMWSARVGACVAIADGTASTGFDTSLGGNRADSDLRRPRGMTGRRQFTPEGTDTVYGSTPGRDNSGEPNPAMGSGKSLKRMNEGVREGELSGMGNPDGKIEVVPADANGQCRPGWIYSARLGGCIRIEDGTAQTGFDTSKGGNTAASDLRKARSMTGRRQFLPEGTDVQLDQSNFNRAHPDNYGTPNRAMGDAGIEVSNRNIDTEQMPGGSRVNDVSVQTRSRESLRQLEMQVVKVNFARQMREEFGDRTSEGELSGLANPDQVLKGKPPDAHGQCPRGTMFSAMVGLCVPLSIDQRGNRTQHTPEGTVTRMGRTYGVDNSDEPNLAMGFTGPLAMLEDEDQESLSKHYAMCMFMLRDTKEYSYYASMHASERFCFIQFEGLYNGYIDHLGYLRHLSSKTLFLTESDEQALNEWLKADESDFNKKTEMDNTYEKELQQRLRYRDALAEFIRRGKSDEQIKRILEQNNIPNRTARSLMTDMVMLRHTTKPIKTPRIIIKMDNETSAAHTTKKPLTRQQQVEQLEDEAKRKPRTRFIKAGDRYPQYTKEDHE